MDYNTFERAFELVRINTVKELEESSKSLSYLIRELNEEKKMLSNDIRFSQSYYSINVSDINKKIKRIEKEIPVLNNKLSKNPAPEKYKDMQSRMVLRVRELDRDRKRYLKVKSDYQNKVLRLNQQLVDLYLDIEEIRRKIIDVANAIYIKVRAEAKNIHFDNNPKAIIDEKEVYDFLKKIEVI